MTMWLDHSHFKNLFTSPGTRFLIFIRRLLEFSRVKLESGIKERLGISSKETNKTLNQLDLTQKRISVNPTMHILDLEYSLRCEYVDVLNQEETLWATKSRSDGIRDGDRNTKFYHVSTLIKKKPLKSQGNQRFV